MKWKVEKKNRLYILFAIALLLMKYNQYLDILLIVFIISCYVFISLKQNFYLYIFFMPFDELLAIPFLGSIFRILQVIIIMKIFYLTLKKDINITYGLKDISLLIFLATYLLCSVIVYKDFEVVGLFINVLIVILIRQSFRSNLDYHLKKIFRMFIFSICIAIFWGLLHKNFVLGGDLKTISMMRFSGTQEPNVMALYINISLLFLLYLDWKARLKVPLFIILYAGLFLTVSISGLSMNIIILCLFLLLNKKLKNIFTYLFTLVVSIIIFILFKEHLTFLDVPMERFQEKVNYILQGNYEYATSGRSDLSEIYLSEFQKLGIHQKLLGIFSFGNDNILSYLNRDVINVSHNTYIDMLFSFGMIGVVIFFTYVIRNLFLKLNSDYFKCLVILKLVLFMSGFTLSMFNARYYYVWMIL